jgi:hypothetical protein
MIQRNSGMNQQHQEPLGQRRVHILNQQQGLVESVITHNNNQNQMVMAGGALAGISF